MGDPYIIATLIHCDDLAKNSCGLPHNSRLQLAPPSIEPQVAPRLQLTFREEPKVPRNGFSFGTNPQGDVFLRGAEMDISSQHFCISFDPERNLVLNDTSRNGTKVSYESRGHWRRDFTWILDIYKEHSRKSREIKVQVGEISFKIEVPSHQDCEDEYKNNVDDFLRKGHASDLTLNALGIDTVKETAIAAELFSKAKELSKDPVYVKIERIGQGAFGEVRMVRNVSTGKKYARKKFFRGGLKREAWLKKVNNEIDIMEKYKHVSVAPPLTQLELIIWKQHIMPVEGKGEGKGKGKGKGKGNDPWLLMPYYGLGNLKDQNEVKSFTRKEIEDILFQILEVLDYLHPEVAHRDLKPENILVESRDPAIIIRIADFGIAKVTEGTNLKTNRGTKPYMAPEISNGQHYTPSVDLWSAGVVVLQYACGLPEMSNWGSWCQDIVNRANEIDGGSDPLINILQTGMLKMDARERLLAHECFERVKTDLSSNDTLDIEGTPRTEGTTPRDDIVDRKGSITVMGEALQSQEPTHISNTILQRTTRQDGAVGDNGSPSHQDEGILHRQKNSNLDDNGNIRSLLGEKDGKSNEQSAGHPITHEVQASVKKRDISTESSNDSHRSKRRRKSTGPTTTSRRLS